MRILLITLVIFSFSSINAQESAVSWEIFYPSNVEVISQSEGEALKSFIDSLIQTGEILSVDIASHTDSLGSDVYNQDLSQRRAKDVNRFLNASCGIDSNKISHAFYGFTRPRGVGGVNRRTEIVFRLESAEFDDEIFELFAMLKRQPAEYWIDNTKDTVIVTENRAMYVIPAKIFNTRGKVKLTIEEHYSVSDMLMHNLTTTSKGAFLETGGMFRLQAFDERGNSIKMRRGKKYYSVVPNRENQKNYQMFDGHFDSDSVIDWTVNQGQLTNMDGLSMFNCRRFGGSRVAKCPLFFCRISSWFKKENPNRSFFSPALSNTDMNPCGALENLSLTLGIESYEFLVENLDSILMAEFGVSSLDEYYEMKEQQRFEKLEISMENGEHISENDLGFFIQQSSNLNWRNIDYFLNIQRPISLHIQTPNVNSARCYMVFKNQKVIIPLPTSDATGFYLKAAPGNTDVTIVVLRYEKGQPYLAMEEINTDEKRFFIEPNPVSVPELKNELQRLDKGKKSFLANR